VEGSEAVVGGRGPTPLDDLDDVVLDVGGGDIGQAARPTLVQERAELLEGLEVGVDGALGLALSL
jgi:hypothetical protein